MWPELAMLVCCFAVGVDWIGYGTYCVCRMNHGKVKIAGCEEREKGAETEGIGTSELERNAEQLDAGAVDCVRVGREVDEIIVEALVVDIDWQQWGHKCRSGPNPKTC